MNATIAVFLLQAVVVSLSGVMAPGPMTAATLAAGTTRRHAGALIAVGHGIIEFPLMFLIIFGVGASLELPGFRIAAGLAGGLALVLMAVQMSLKAARRASADAGLRGVHPVWIGVVLSGGNPYLLLWWATVGLALAVQARQLGLLAFGLFAVVHWLCDLVWLEVLSQASFRGSKLLGPRSGRVILVFCAVAMAGFGVYFICDALGWLGR